LHCFRHLYYYRPSLLIFLVTSLLACTTQKKSTEQATPSKKNGQTLRVCTGTSYSILPIIAQQKGFFALEGLAVELIPYAIGRDAMEAMLAGKCEVATSADTPVADYGLKRDDLRIIASIASSDKLCYIVARIDSKIRTAKDLKGCKVAVTRGTAPHFFLDLVLNKNRLQEKDLQLQFLKGDALHQALLDGTVAAIATTDLNAYRLQEQQGEAVVLINEPGIVLNHGYLTTLESNLAGKADALKRLLIGLRQAELWVSANPAEARSLFATYLKVTPRVAEQTWENIVPRLGLSPAMILTLEDNARWLREREGAPPSHKSFKNIFRPQLLQSVAPESVTLH
jgi:NitT/TauT family transport system substrate-binding protein